MDFGPRIGSRSGIIDQNETVSFPCNDSLRVSSLSQTVLQPRQSAITKRTRYKHANVMPGVLQESSKVKRGSRIGADVHLVLDTEQSNSQLSIREMHLYL